MELTSLDDFKTEILRFVTYVHLPFSLGSLDLFVASLVKGTSCCVIRRNLKYSIEPLDRGGAMVNFKRS